MFQTDEERHLATVPQIKPFLVDPTTQTVETTYVEPLTPEEQVALEVLNNGTLRGDKDTYGSHCWGIADDPAADQSGKYLVQTNVVQAVMYWEEVVGFELTETDAVVAEKVVYVYKVLGYKLTTIGIARCAATYLN